MFNRSCRESAWSPLATQQLRLRNLVQVTSGRIRCSQESRIYFTLHLSAMSAPFYTSEKVESGEDATWQEIHSPTILKSSARCVCIRIWQHDLSGDKSDNDKQVIFWGVYFSGLIQIDDTARLRENCLVFHMHGGCFTAAESVTENPQGDSKFLTIENGGSPMKRAVEMLKRRFLFQKVPPSDVSESYNIFKLLSLQQKQRQLKNKRESSKEIVDRISVKSPACLNLSLIANSAVFQPQRRSVGMGRQLTRLLNQQPERPDPEVILQAQKLRQKIEVAKFRVRLLAAERDRARTHVRQLEGGLGRLCDTNIETESWLMTMYRKLSRERDDFLQRKVACAANHDAYDSVRTQLTKRRQHLLRELSDIYNVRQHEGGFYTINGISLPDSESFTGTIPAMSVSVALGYAAHAVQMCSVILNIPLRNPIILDGSRTKIVDNIKVLADADRVFPLYCRIMPPPDVTQYAVFLLNQNIAQLQFQLGITKRDLRTTLANLMQLTKNATLEMFSGKHSLELPTQNLSNYGSSVEINVPVNRNFTSNNDVPKGHRISRSMDNYRDDEMFRDFKNHFMSDPVLYRKGK
uniref:UV radiation resistance-associated gene protein n=1 Tax=Phlebotomus kandelakii TaxID=1109342 RepID=A0A6B2EAN3_9DIPT